MHALRISCNEPYNTYVETFSIQYVSFHVNDSHEIDHHENKSGSNRSSIVSCDFASSCLCACFLWCSCKQMASVYFGLENHFLNVDSFFHVVVYVHYIQYFFVAQVCFHVIVSFWSLHVICSCVILYFFSLRYFLCFNLYRFLSLQWFFPWDIHMFSNYMC